MGKLAIHVKWGEVVTIGPDIKLECLRPSRKGGDVRIAIDAPRELQILRFNPDGSRRTGPKKKDATDGA